MGKIRTILRNKDVGEMGVGAMIVFIAMVLVAGIAAAVLIQTANRLEIQAMQTGEQTKGEVATGIAVFDIIGKVSGSVITNLTITIKPRAGSGDIDLNNTVIEITDGTTKALLAYNVVDTWNFNSTIDQNAIYHANVFDTGMWNESNEEFGIIVVEDPDTTDSCSQATPVINRGDKVMLCINAYAIFGGGLSARDDVWGIIIPEEGSPGVFAFRVPPSLTDTVYDLY
ncbi:MAG: flagellin [Methanobacteriota archaeon]